MVSKIISLLIALNACSLLAHDNFNQISANAGTSALNSSHLKLNHQSYFYIQNGDALFLDLKHALHYKHFQNDIGLGYRKSFEKVGVGANFYYMHSNQSKTLLHQFSPGLELLYKNLQVAYNLYLPTSLKLDLKRGSILHNRISELGLKWHPRKEITVGILPFYDHTKNKWGIDSKIIYTIKDKFELGLSPYFKSQEKGCVFSFGFNFGSAKDMKSTYRSNAFIYFIENIQLKSPQQEPEPDRTSQTITVPMQPAEESPPEHFVDDGQEWSHWWYKAPFVGVAGAAISKALSRGNGQTTTPALPTAAGAF